MQVVISPSSIFIRGGFHGDWHGPGFQYFISHKTEIFQKDLSPQALCIPDSSPCWVHNQMKYLMKWIIEGGCIAVFSSKHWCGTSIFTFKTQLSCPLDHLFLSRYTALRPHCPGPNMRISQLVLIFSSCVFLNTTMNNLDPCTIRMLHSLPDHIKSEKTHVF